MTRLGHWKGLLGGGVVVLSSLLVGGPAALAAAAPKSPKVVTCAMKAVVEPASYTISCADGNTALKAAHWTSWTASKATATATYVYNTCYPNCAAGKFVSVHATVTLSTVVSSSHGKVFSKLVASYTSAKKKITSTFFLAT